MSLEVRREGEKAIVLPHGDIVATVVPDYRPTLRDLVRSGLREMVIDLSETVMIDSTGLGLLLAAFNSLRAIDGKLSVVNASEDIVELFRSLRMHQHFPVAGR